MYVLHYATSTKCHLFYGKSRECYNDVVNGAFGQMPNRSTKCAVLITKSSFICVCVWEPIDYFAFFYIFVGMEVWLEVMSFLNLARK